jgi:predicted P-loop ATPase
LILILAGKEYFNDQSILGVSGREAQEQREGVWMYEHADLQGMRKTEVEKVKADASRQEDRARPAYGRVREDRPRRSIDWGTTNDDEYLQSQTGNRRFWPVKVGRIDIEAVRRDREQLLGEAATYEAAGESITLDPSLWGDAGEAQEQRRVKDPWEEILAANTAHIHNNGDGYECAASAELLEHVLTIPRWQQNSSHTRRLALSMKHIGWMTNRSGRVTIDGKQVRGYIRPAVPTSGANFQGLMIRDALRAIDTADPPLSPDAGPAIGKVIAPHLGRVAPHLGQKDVEAQGAAMLQHLLNARLVQVEEIKVSSRGPWEENPKYLILTAAGKKTLTPGRAS